MPWNHHVMGRCRSQNFIQVSKLQTLSQPVNSSKPKKWRCKVGMKGELEFVCVTSFNLPNSSAVLSSPLLQVGKGRLRRLKWHAQVPRCRWVQTASLAVLVQNCHEVPAQVHHTTLPCICRLLQPTSLGTCTMLVGSLHALHHLIL